MKYKINKGFISQKMDNKITIFDSEQSILYTFNDTAALVFNGLKKGESIKKIAEMIREKFNVTTELALEDIRKCIKDLVNKKIIKSA